MSTNEITQLTMEETSEQVNSTEELDVTRQGRQTTLSIIKDVLDKGQTSSKINQKDLRKALVALYSLGQQVDETISAIICDMFSMVKAIAQSESNTFAIRTNMKALIRALEQKNIINQEEMEKIFKEVLNEEIQTIESQQQSA